VEIDSVCNTMIKSGAGSIKRYGVRLFVCLCVRPSVCPSVGPQQQTRCCRFTGVGPAGKKNIDRLLQQRRANAGSATLSAYVGS